MNNQQLISNRYQLGKLLSEGGMGKVYLGADTQSGQPVAIKLLRSDMVVGQPDMVERFLREAEALRILNHPNIVKVLATGSKEGQQYIVMEFVAGGSLRDLLDREGQLTIGRTLEITLDLADALTRAHRLEIIHRDLKPANVLLADDGTPRLSDFGIAKVDGAYLDITPGLTQAGTIMGTIEYLSPEACRGEVLDARSDIWSLGVMLFEMLVGRPAFPSQTAQPNTAAILSAILTQPMPELQVLRADAPNSLVDLIYRMVTKELEARIPSMRLVGAELEAIMQGMDAGQQYATASIAAPPRFATPTPQPSGIPRHNLPRQTTPFIGREKELADLAHLIADPDNRLITLLGPGGSGKTRLALETARAQLPNFESGVTFVSLAPLRSARDIIPTIAEAVGFQFFERMDPSEQLAGYFREKRTLLVLDNFEHLLDGAELISEILRAASGVKVLATSREKLNLQEEIRFRIDGMDFPQAIQPTSLEDAFQYSAIRLFMQAAKRARPSFGLVLEDLRHVIRICHLVSGMPLGILLAAAWVEIFSPQEIADEVSRSLDFLETSVSDIPDRHRSIRAVFDSTWTQLMEVERESFMKLAIFRGGFKREAALVVAGASLHKLVTLVNKSLLHRDPVSGRYEVHELLRQYAEEQLEVYGKIETARDAHCLYYAVFLQERLFKMLGPNQVKALNEIEAEFGNVRQAWHWAVEKKDFDAIGQASESLFVFSDMRSREHEGVALIGLAREQLAPQRGGEAHATWGRLLLPWYDLLLQSIGRPKDNQEIIMQANTCLALAQQREDQLGMAHALILLGHFAEPAEAIKMYERALELVPRLDDSFWVRIRIGFCYRALGEHQEEIKAFQQSYQRGREIGESEKMGYGLFNLGESEMLLGDHESALTHFQGAKNHLHQVGTLWGIILANINLSLLALLKGEFNQARSLIEEAQEIAKESNRSNRIKKEVLTVLGYLALIEQDYQRAKHLFEEILSAYTGSPEASLGLSFTACGLEDYKTAGQYLDDALQPSTPYLVPAMVILCLPAAALSYRDEGEAEQAVELLAVATDHPQGLKDLLHRWPLIMRLRKELEVTLTQKVFDLALERGQALDLTETVTKLTDHYHIEDQPLQSLDKRKPVLPPNGEQTLVEPLSEREMDVLRLLQTELSGPEIARELMVSLNTVRFHTKNIYAKLEVNNRRSAVNRAIELGL
jgi:serine/threonine protein kinase/DNA-binding CsgD family transcriptional regulator/tetratricopeptide (TPR) repeat protein